MYEEQGRIHGYRSRLRMGMGSNDKGLLKHIGRSSNAKDAEKRQKRQKS